MELSADVLGYDLWAAITCNEVKVPASFEVLGEVLSAERDEGEYFWLIRDLSSKKLYVINGAHDYTGWECQSGANISEPFDSLEQLHLIVPEYDNQNRKVREMLRQQALSKITGKDDDLPPAAA
jgi:hypothetical protein